MARAPIAALAVAISSVLAGCRCDDAPPAGRGSSASTPAREVATSPPTIQKAATALPADPTLLGEVSHSAYGVDLAILGGVPTVVTSDEIVRFPDGGEMQAFAVDLGPVRAIWGEEVVFWKEGELRRVPVRGGPTKRLGPLAVQPARLLASEHRLAWLASGPGDASGIFTWHNGEVRPIHRSDRSFSTAAIAGDWVYFVERPEPGTWNLAAVSVTQGASQVPSRSATSEGRTPSMLAIDDAVYLYDGPMRAVRRYSLDLGEESIAAQNAICSPLAVSRRIYCGHVEGLFEVAPDGTSAERIVQNLGGPITAIAAADPRVVWLVDAGESSLRVFSLEGRGP